VPGGSPPTPDDYAVYMPTARPGSRVPLAVERIADARIAALYERPLVLVRPDGHVARRGERVVDADRLVDTVRGAA
jgi:hypothetical protein